MRSTLSTLRDTAQNFTKRCRDETISVWAGKLARWGIKVLLAVFVLLGLSYMLNTPLFESADESSHLQVIDYMRRTRSLPPPVITGRRAETGADMAWSLRYHDPPLYYAPPLYHALGALLTGWISMDDLQSRLIPSPAWEAGYAPGLGSDLTWNQNIYVHLPDETFRESPTVRVAMVLRLVSLLLGSVTVWCAYEIAREFARKIANVMRIDNLPYFSDLLALGAAAWVALNPQFINVSSGVTNDPLLNAIFSLALLGMLRCMHRANAPGASWGRWAGLGALVGLGMLTKQSALILLPLGGLAILGQTRRQVGKDNVKQIGNLLFRKVWPKYFIEGLAFGGTALAIGGWWYGLNALRYGDPLGVVPHFSGQVPLPRFDIEALLTMFKSYWMGFGWGTPAPAWICAAVSVITMVAAVGLGRALLPGGSFWLATSVARRALLLLATALGLNVLGLMRWAVATGSPFGRLLFPTIAATGGLCAWGIAQGWHLRSFRWSIMILVGALLFFDAGVPWLRIRPSFRSPYLPGDVVASAREQDNFYRLDVSFDGGVRLLGYNAQGETLYPNDILKVTLYWQAQETPQLYTLWSQFGPQDPTRYVVGYDRWLGGTLYPSAFWRNGDIIRQTVRLRLPAWTPAPALYWLRLGLVDDQGTRLSLATGEDKVTLGPWRVRTLETPPPLESQVDFRLGDIKAQATSGAPDSGPQGEVQLVGYELGGSGSDGALTETLAVTLAWQSHAVLKTDYVAFVHLLDDQGNLVTQHDSPPSRGSRIYPMSWWLPGDVILDRHELLYHASSISATLQSATLQSATLQSATLRSATLQVGLYDPVTLQRFPAYDEKGERLPNDVILLVEIMADAE